MLLSTNDMLSDDYLKERSGLINPDAAQIFEYGVPADGGTVYVTAADESGLLVSYIQSNFMGFGSGIVVPSTGISLQDRGVGFTLENNHPNQVGPSKRPFQTIIPGFISKNGTPYVSFGLMGGSMQPQGHIQMVLRLLVQNENPQSASDAPRWRLIKDLTVEIEDGMPESVVTALKGKGHHIVRSKADRFGGAQILQVIEGGYLAASDHRKDGCAAGV